METILTEVKNAKWLVLFGMIASLALIFLDQSAVPVALTSIQQQLMMGGLSLQWVLNAYLLVIAVLIIPGGKLADIYGHKKFFVAGIFTFLIASCLCALAFNGVELIAGRVLQGLGAAIMLPASAVIITSVVSPQERGKMMGIYIAVASIFLAIGPMIGGVVTQYLGWRWVFWLNLPFALFSMFAINKATRILASKAIRKTLRKVDWLGLTCLALSITPLIVALLQSVVLGWNSPILWCLVAISSVSILFFIKAEKYRSQPLLDLKMLSALPVRVGITIIILTQFAIVSIAFWPSFMQEVLKFTAAQAGLGLIPVTLPIMIVSPIAGWLMDKHGPRLPVTMGAFCLVFGSVWVGASAWSQNYLIMLPGLFVFGCGPSFLLACMMTFLFSVVEEHKRGSLAGFTGFFRQLGSTMGLALSSTILSNAYMSKVAAGFQTSYASQFAFTCSTFAIALLSLTIVWLLKYLPNVASEYSSTTTQPIQQVPQRVTE